MNNDPTPLDGTCRARFEPLRELFAARLESGDDLGASLAVNIDGEMVVDLWGGWADEARTMPWTENTITCVFSTTKTMTSLAALVLVDRGELDLDANVAAYWPEFAARDKAGIKVRQLLSHTSGVSGWDQPVTIDDVYDWDKSTAMLAAQAPWWEPGTGSGYHALTYGHLIGEVIRRITGQRLGEFFAARLAGPLRADFHIGLPSSEFSRVANVVAPQWPPADLTRLDPHGPAFKTFTGPELDLNIEHSRTERWRRRHRRGQRAWQCPLGGASPVGGGLRRRSRGGPAAFAGDDQPNLRSAKPQGRPGARDTAQDRRRLWLALAGCAPLRPGRPGLFRGWRGRLPGARRLGTPPDRRLRDEQGAALPDRRPHRGGAGRAVVRHRESPGRLSSRPPPGGCAVGYRRKRADEPGRRVARKKALTSGRFYDTIV